MMFSKESFRPVAVFTSLLGVVFLLCVTTQAQLPTSTPQNAGVVKLPTQPANDVRRRMSYPETSDPFAREASYQHAHRGRYIDPLYRKPNREELARVAVDPSLAARFGSFLRLPKTGIIRLMPETECSANTAVVSASEKCLLLQFPGAGNTFSFRSRGYVGVRPADIALAGKAFRLPGVHTQGIIAALGDVPIENLALNSMGVKALDQLRVPQKAGEVREFANRVSRGLDLGYVYRNTAAVELDRTYALRSIAFDGKSLRAVVGATYNEFDYDNRRDVLVVFRVIEVADDGSVTILWRELKTQRSPKIIDAK